MLTNLKVLTAVMILFYFCSIYLTFLHLCSGLQSSLLSVASRWTFQNCSLTLPSSTCLPLASSANTIALLLFAKPQNVLAASPLLLLPISLNSLVSFNDHSQSSRVSLRGFKLLGNYCLWSNRTHWGPLMNVVPFVFGSSHYTAYTFCTNFIYYKDTHM